MAPPLGNSETTFSLLGRISLTVVLGGIPFNVTVGAGLEIASTPAGRGEHRLQRQGPILRKCRRRRLGGLDSNQLTLDGSSASDARLTVGYRVSNVFPEVGVGVGVEKLATGNAFLRFKQELITNFRIERELGLLGVPTGESRSCLRANVGVGATYGGSAFRAASPSPLTAKVDARAHEVTIA